MRYEKSLLLPDRMQFVVWILPVYKCIGRRIQEEEQNGKERADYGAYLLKNLAKKLEPEYGSGFSVRQLERSRQFYKMYPIASALRSQFNWTQIETVRRLAENPDGEYVGDIL